MQLTQAEKSYRQIRQKLTGGELSPGQQLVNRSLATELGVSLGPLREAINRLATEGFLDQVPGAGAFVRQLTRQDLEELYVLRDAIESCAAAEAANYIRPSQLERLDAICDEWAKLADHVAKRSITEAELDAWLDCEERFHEILLDASRNRLLAKVVRDQRAISQVFNAQRGNPALLTAEVADRTVASHRELVEALRRRDPETARRLTSQQIQIGCRTVLEYFHQQPSSGRMA